MSRYIDVDAYERELRTSNIIHHYGEQIVDKIHSTPSIDIVRCQECKHGEYREDYDDYLCRDDGICVHDADWFCADGEREGE